MLSAQRKLYVHAARMETFNAQYVTALHDRCGTCLEDIALRYFRAFTLYVASGTGAPRCTLLGTRLDINATRSERIVSRGQIDILYIYVYTLFAEH